ncbi:hypothetical protein HDR63_00245 [bacterium]|nr:hypothetical protein [bacterium]
MMNDFDKGFRNGALGLLFLFCGAPFVVWGMIGLTNLYLDRQNKPKSKEFVSAIYAAPNHTDTVTVYELGTPLQLIDRNGHIAPHVSSVTRDKFFTVFNIERNDKLLVQADSLNNLHIIQNITKDMAKQKITK